MYFASDAKECTVRYELRTDQSQQTASVVVGLCTEARKAEHQAQLRGHTAWREQRRFVYLESSTGSQSVEIIMRARPPYPAF